MQSPTEKLKLEVMGAVAQITISNPPANTWDAESLAALPKIIKELNENKLIYSLVITGEGEKFFSAGADLKMFADGDAQNARRLAELFGEAFESLTNFRGVSIAAVNGYAMGGGLECALACDIRILEEQAQVALPEAKVGLLPCAGGTQNLTRLVGEGWTKRMILCGERLKAQKAFEIGLAEEVVPTGSSLETALKLAKEVGSQSPIAVQFCKKLIQNTRGNSHNETLPLERDYFVDLFSTSDQKEGVHAFLEKRSPEWKNA